ncbi:DUF4231 domain-containing protein [Mycoplasma sp. Ms02]|uniref:DUF4231 domain-containing protein n=1 Tax=Mycoplasma sp. Ms02 TaxID=353851 RepID=UPI001C89547A|nr:DUF4231 domain-containing protein [Mycoplasma sp. Ms02]QZE12657.1 DUF4231 domain-containing protein [Mycoplasma sp. Ms02]
MEISPYHFFEREKKLVERKILVYGALYYTLNLLSIFIALFLAVIAALFLAGNNNTGYESPSLNPYRTFLNESTNYIFIITGASCVTSFISAILAFFVVNQKFQNYKSQITKIRLEYVLFKSNSFYYAGLSEDKKAYTLYKRTLTITNRERYLRTEIKEMKNA